MIAAFRVASDFIGPQSFVDRRLIEKFITIRGNTGVFEDR